MGYSDQRAALRRGERATFARDAKVDESWTKDEIKEYLDGVGVEYSSSMTKAELLALVP